MPTQDLGKIDINKTLPSQSDSARMAAIAQIAQAHKLGVKPSKLVNDPTAVPKAEAQAKQNFFKQMLGSLSTGAMAYAEGMGAGKPYSNFIAMQQANLDRQTKSEQAKAAFEQQRFDNDIKTREINVKESDAKNKINISNPEGLSPDQQLEAYNIGVEIAGMRKVQDVLPMIYGMMKQGKSRDEIADKMRMSGQSKLFTGDIRDAAQSVFANASDVKTQKGMDYIDDYLSRGDTEGALTQLKKSARDQADVETRKQLLGKERTVEFVNEIEGDLKRLKDAGIDTNIFSGTKENIANKIGAVKDKELRKIATKISLGVFNYRRSMSGVAFPEAETKSYQRVFPDITKNAGLNAANIEALKEVFGGDVEQFYRASIGDKTYNKLFNKNAPTESADVPSSGNATDMSSMSDAELMSIIQGGENGY